jgi:hypothetical protein
MAGSSFWSRLIHSWRPRTRAERNIPRPRHRLDVERLGDRTLLSGFTTLVEIGPGFEPVHQEVLYSFPLLQIVHTANDPIRLVEAEYSSIETSPPADIAVAAFPSSSDASRFERSPVGADGSGHSIKLAQSSQESIYSQDSSPGADNPGQGDSRDEGLQLLFSRWQGLGGEQGAEPNFSGLDGYQRGPEEMDHAILEQGMLASLLRPEDSERGERSYLVDSGTRDSDVSEDDSSRPDTAGTELLMTERIENPILSRPLASIFRDQQPNEPVEEEAPADRVPDLLVSYDPDLSMPQTELLPLEDGSSAVVAALVAGVVTDSGAVPLTVVNPETTLTGSPVGLDSGPPVADRSPVVPSTQESQAVAAEPPAGAPRTARTTCNSPGTLLSGSAADQLPPEEDWLGSGGTARPTSRWFDALLAAGVVVLNRHADGSTAQDRRRKRTP